MIKLTPLIKEANYEDFFSPETIASLKNQSKDSLQKMLGGKGLQQVMGDSQKLLFNIIQAEKPYIPQLEKLAVEMVKDIYPIINYANIKIDAKIVGMGEINLDNDSEDKESDDLPQQAVLAKRRIINGMTQGASVRGAFGFMMFKEALDKIDPTLISKYNEILKLAFGIYDNEEAIALLLQLLAQNTKMEGGSSEIEYDEENNQFVVKARALCFPMLVHEIIKGLYEIVGTEGFSADKEKNKDIISKVDKLKNEPHDLQYGKFIYDALNNLYIDSDVEDGRIRELLFASIYKLPDEEFVQFIENAIHGKLSNDQKLFIKNEIRDIERDLKKDDTHLDDLDEIKVGGRTEQLLDFLRKNRDEVIANLAEYMEAEELEDERDITFEIGEGEHGNCVLLMNNVDGEVWPMGFAIAFKPKDFGVEDDEMDEDDVIPFNIGGKKLYVLTFPI